MDGESAIGSTTTTMGMDMWRTASLGIRLIILIKQVSLEDCPKLTALPRGLRHSSIQQLFIEEAHSLTRVGNLPFLTDFLNLKNNSNLEIVCDLPALRQLAILDCPMLRLVAETALKDNSMKCLPDWLLKLLQQKRQLQNDRFELQIGSNANLLEKCREGGEYWPILSWIPIITLYECEESLGDADDHPSSIGI